MNSLYKISTWCFVLLLFSFQAKAVSSAPLKEGSLMVDVTVFSHFKALKNVHYEVVVDNMIVDSGTVARSNRMKIMLPYGHRCAIFFYASEHQMKFLLFDTFMEGDTKFMPTKYLMKVNLLKRSYVQGLDTDILDFPAGIIRFDTKSRMYEFSKKYDKNFGSKYAELLKAAEQKKHSALIANNKDKR